MKVELIVDLRSGKVDLYICSLCCPQRAGVVDSKTMRQVQVNIRILKKVSQRLCFCSDPKQVYIYLPEWRGS
jgi:hypothetical protein